MALDFKRRRENQRKRVPAPTLIKLTEVVLTCRVYFLSIRRGSPRSVFAPRPSRFLLRLS